jgi:pyruvate oxidase
MNVCEALLDVLADYGVKHIFGIPGDAINELIDAIRKQDRIKFIHVMHEEAGAFAASAQAKLTGELAVCAGTAGPGAIHLLNGLYDARMDHAPVLAITGQVETAMIGTAYHQEVNLQALFDNVAEYSQTIYDVAQMPESITLAVQTAIGKRTVTHISIPTNIAGQTVPNYKKQKQVLHTRTIIRPCEEDLKKAAELINKSVSPCILAGIGAKHAVSELIDFAQHIKAPIIKSLRGKEILPDEHPYVLGGTGLLGTRPSLKATQSCDLFIVIGSDLPYLDFYPEGVPTIQIDNEMSQVGRRHPVTIPLVGDAKTTLKELQPMLIESTNDSFLEGMQTEMRNWLKEQDKKELSTENPIHPQAVARAVSDLSNDDAVIICDTGAVTVWAARNFRIKGTQQFTLSGGLSSMAFGLPGAIGAKLIFPHKQVIALCGDGGFAMLMSDFATAVKYKLDIKIIVFNNSKLGLIQMEERVQGNPEFETEIHNPDYAAFAKICQGEGFEIRAAAELKPVLGKAFSTKGPCIVNVFINPNEITWPPHVSMHQAVNYVKAKIRELIS